MQTGDESQAWSEDYVETKEKLRRRLGELNDRLNRLLAQQYGVDPDKLEYEAWLKSHQPFHWFVEFYGILKDGGFGVIIGNPPWKEYAAVRKQYQVQNYRTMGAGNLYGLCIERSINLRSAKAWLSFIVQLPLVSSSRMEEVREVLSDSHLYVASFDDRPGKLFDGLQHCRSTIFIAAELSNREKGLFSTRYNRWPTQARPHLFDRLEYTAVTTKTSIFSDQFPKYANQLHSSIFGKVKTSSTDSIGTLRNVRETPFFIFYQEATQYWVKASVGLPYYAKNGNIGAPAHGRYLYFETPEMAYRICAVMHSSLFYGYFISYGDCFHLSQTLSTGFPLPKTLAQDNNLTHLGQRLTEDLVQNSVTKSIRTRDGDEITYAEYYGSKSKGIIDQIDTVLAQHYGFTAEELDYILNYDIKYRMGDELTADITSDE
jgi:hypothetical protein